MSEETRGRRPKTDIVPAAQLMDNYQLAVTNDKQKLAEVNQVYGGDLPYERLRLMNEVIQFTRCAQESILQAGRRLIILKTNEEHGSWMATIEQIGLSQKYVERAMSVARGFGKFDNLSNLTQSQFKAISFFSEEEKALLDEGKDVLGFDIDDISRMTKKEIEAAYREEIEKRKADKEASAKRLKAIESVIKAKEEKLTELELEVANRLPPTKTELAQLALDDLRRDYMEAILHAGYEVRRALEVITKAQAIENVNFTQLQEFVHQYDEHYAILCERRDTLEDAINNACPDKKE